MTTIYSQAQSGILTKENDNITTENIEKQMLLNEQKNDKTKNLEEIKFIEKRKQIDEKIRLYNKQENGKSKNIQKIEAKDLIYNCNLKKIQVSNVTFALSTYKNNYKKLIENMNNDIKDIENQITLFYNNIKNNDLTKIRLKHDYAQELRIIEKYEKLIDTKIKLEIETIYTKYKELIIKEQNIKNQIIIKNVNSAIVDFWTRRLNKEDENDLKIIPEKLKKKYCIIM